MAQQHPPPRMPVNTGLRQSLFAGVFVGGLVATSIAYFGATTYTFIGLLILTGLVGIWFAGWLYLSREVRAEYRATRRAQMTPDQVRRWQTAKVTALVVLCLYLLGIALMIIALS